jgi:Uri superfamily endonuclease
MGQAGTYMLVLHVGQETEISIGRLGTFNFPSGYYLYAGSARGPGGVEARLARHLRERKQSRWHIDYLLREARVVEIWKISSRQKLECLWTQALLRTPDARIPVSGFGSSDCGCPTHLVYFASLPCFHTFAKQLHALGAGPPLHREVPEQPSQD